MHIYDVFGLANQTLQGADLLAARLNAVVLVPDFFKGDALEAHMLPADTDEKKKRIGSFLATSANVERNLGVLLAAVPEYRVRFPSVSKWGANGLCWGGKVSLDGNLSLVIVMGGNADIRNADDDPRIRFQHPFRSLEPVPSRVSILSSSWFCEVKKLIQL